MKRFRNIILSAAIVAAFLAGGRHLDAKPEYSKKEKTACVTCHVKNGAKELNEKGTYYKTNKALPK